MKVGVRKPSLKKSISARTTGRIKRTAKRSINPLYGKKGMGWVNDPEKAMYNKVYHKTTVGVNDIIKDSTSHGKVRTGEFILSIFQLIFAIFQMIFWGAIVTGILYFIFTIIF